MAAGGVDPTGVLDMQVGLNNGGVPGGGADSAGARPSATRGPFDGIPDFIGDGTPRVLAAMLLGALVTLIALRALGFRFSFGVGVGS